MTKCGLTNKNKKIKKPPKKEVSITKKRVCVKKQFLHQDNEVSSKSYSYH